jgi:glycosyltransferase involved in cell wall biosynthesis
MDSILLRPDIRDKLNEITEADILVGIPSYNNASMIGHVVRAVQAGMAKYFPDKKTVLVNSDGGSTDGTTDVVQATAVEDFQSILLHHRVSPFSDSDPIMEFRERECFQDDIRNRRCS